MKVCVLLLCVCCFCWRTEAQSRTYLITAPLSLHVDAEETVVVQLFGFTDEVTVYVFLRSSMAPEGVVLVREAVTLNTQNHHQGAAKVRLFPDKLDKSLNHVILHVQSNEINQHLSVPVSRSNGFLFIQTDKPLYTPLQSVKVRAFSMNQELRPANRSVFLTFRDPDHKIVDVVEMNDSGNGIPSMKNPFKIPIKPKLGIWFIEATYSSDFTTTARSDFEIREYVLPSLSILVEPEANYITSRSFSFFRFKVSARYLHGVPVADGEVFLRYGYIGKDTPVIIPSSIVSETLSSTGEVDVSVNMSHVLSSHNGPKTLNSLVGKYLYIAVLLKESTGGITQEAEFSAVKFVKFPYSLSLVSTAPFIKPGLPYNIQVLVKDHLEKPVKRVPVRLIKQDVITQAGQAEAMSCSDSTVSQSDGIAVFICNTPRDGVKAELKFQTADPNLLTANQASLGLTATAYHSPNQRYLYIDPPLPGQGLRVGHYANIRVYSSMPSSIPLKTLSYLVVSKGKVVDFNSQKLVSGISTSQALNFKVTSSMFPSIRLLVYYILYGEGTSELVADSVWLDVEGEKCVNGLQTELSCNKQDYRPKQNLQLDIKTNQGGVVALSAVDSAVYVLRPHYQDPITRVLRHIEQSDQGCGGGGGKDSADVFRLAGLTFFTNANTHPSASDEACRAIVRPKRSLSKEEKEKEAKKYGPWKRCCEYGMRHMPKILTCKAFASQIIKSDPYCRDAFRKCCEFFQKNMETSENLILARNEMGANFDEAPLVRSYFPESWLWEVRPASPGQQSINRKLPDSLTTWEIKAIGMLETGMCVSETVQVPVRLPLSIDVPLPYQVVRGEQLVLKGSVYNQQADNIEYCVTLTVSPAVCLLQSLPVAGGLHSTKCVWSSLFAGSVGKVTFTLMGLEPGEHTLTFTLKTLTKTEDIVEKKLRVVPEGVMQEEYSGGTLDPQGLYFSEKRTVVLKNKKPPNVVPNTPVERMLTINGEVLGDVLSVVNSAEGFQQLTNLPAGSAEAELGRLLSLAQVYLYLETTASWNILGADIQKSSESLMQKIRDGVVSISSFRRKDSSYSMWRKRESSIWLTALAVKTLSVVDQVFPVDHQDLSESVFWLIRKAQGDGSFKEISSFKPNKIMATEMEQSVYLTSFVLIALKKANSINDAILQLQLHDTSMNSAADYISQHAPAVKSVYVRAVATYALILHDRFSVTADGMFDSLKKLARQKGHPAVLRYWQEPSVTADWLKPDQTSGMTVETTAFLLLAFLQKGGSSAISYVNPILSWLTQDQHYGKGFYSLQDTVLTLEALKEYSQVIQRAVLDQEISIHYSNSELLRQVELSQSQPVASPIQVSKDHDITVSTGYGKGVSTVKMKTVYYQTTPSSQTCNFNLTIDVVSANTDPNLPSPHLVACAKYIPPPNELLTESGLTVMKIQLPTGVEGYLDDLREFRDGVEPMISDYELQGTTVVIQMDSVPSKTFLCVGFRIRIGFTVGAASKSLFSVYEPQDKGSMCTKQFSYQEQKLQLLCTGEQCQCMKAACATYRGNVDLTLTTAKRFEETCQPHIKYAYKVTVKSSTAEGDFVAFTAEVVEVLKNIYEEFEAVSPGTEVELLKKVTCSSVDIQDDKQYLVMGSSGSEVALKYRLPLDSEATVELWPADCVSPECLDYISQLNDHALDLQLNGCMDS